MKKIFVLLSLILCCSLSFAQITQKRFDAGMRDAAEMMNGIAPIPMDDDMGFLDYFSYKNKVLTIDVRTNEGKLDYSQVKANGNVAVKIYAIGVRMMVEALWEVSLEEVDKSSYVTLYDYFEGVRMIFVEENTHKGYDLFIPSAEIKAAKQVDLDLYSDDKVFKDSLLQVMQEDGTDVTLKTQFEELTKRSCPMEVSTGMYIDAIQYENKTLKYVFRLPLNYADIDSVAMRQNIFDRIANPSKGSTLELVEYMKQLESGIAFEMHFQDKTVEWIISPEELSQHNQNGVVADAQTLRARLEQSCAEINAQTPVILDEITRLDSAMLEGNNYVYCYTITADFTVDFDSKETINGIHTSNQLSLYAADLLLVNFMEELVDADMNLIFRYINGKNGKIISDTFTKQDLQDIIDSKKDE